MIVPLSEIAYVAKSKPPGFFEEALRRGTVKDACLELSDSDVAFLKSFSSANFRKNNESLSPVNIELTTSTPIKIAEKPKKDLPKVEPLKVSESVVDEV